MKTLLKTLLPALMLFTISCTKEPLAKPQQISTQTQDNATVPAAHFIGEHFGGGIIFYIDLTGLHGMIADTADLISAVWYNGTYTITGVTDVIIGSGNANTKEIVSLQGKPGKYAALECWKSKRNGFTDWYLPSRDELSQIYQQRSIIPNLVLSNYYWSSSEIHDSSVFGWGVYFFSGVQYANPKNYIGNVRAIRSF